MPLVIPPIMRETGARIDVGQEVALRGAPRPALDLEHRLVRRKHRNDGAGAIERDTRDGAGGDHLETAAADGERAVNAITVGQSGANPESHALGERSDLENPRLAGLVEREIGQVALEVQFPVLRGPGLEGRGQPLPRLRTECERRVLRDGGHLSAADRHIQIDGARSALDDTVGAARAGSQIGVGERETLKLELGSSFEVGP